MVPRRKPDLDQETESLVYGATNSFFDEPGKHSTSGGLSQMRSLPPQEGSLARNEATRVDFMCLRLHEALAKKEKLRASAKNVKVLQARLKLSRPTLPIKDLKRHSADYDSSQQTLTKWLRANPIGQQVNGSAIE